VYFHPIGSDSSHDAYVLGKGLPKVAEIALSNQQSSQSLVPVG
jgi:hypothetical protein